MGWVLLGAFLTVVYFALWALEWAFADNDDDEMRRYQTQREQFERWFE